MQTKVQVNTKKPNYQKIALVVTLIALIGFVIFIFWFLNGLGDGISRVWK